MTEPPPAEPSQGTGMSRRGAGNSLWLIAQPLLLNAISIVSTGYIARKLGEEGTEAVIAALAGDDEELIGEAADVIFHLMVLLAHRGKTAPSSPA